MSTLLASYGERQPPGFVIAATLAAELGQIIRHARGLSLSSKNARVITVRAGEWGRGFSGITGFIDEYARRTIATANNIHLTSRQLSRDAVNKLFAESTAERLGAVSRRSPASREAIEPCRVQVDRAIAGYAQAAHDAHRSLARDIDEIKSCSRALNSLVAICRIEASRAGPFQEALAVIASEIETATGRLVMSLGRGRSLLDLIHQQDSMHVSIDMTVIKEAS